MRHLIVSTFMTLDGIMQAPGGPEEDRDGDFAHGGWSVGYWDDKVAETMAQEMSEPFESLLGRKTYEIFAAYWPNSEEEGADVINNSKRYVVSNSLKNPTWKNTELISGNVMDEIQKLKNSEGPNIHVSGSSNLIQSLLASDLVDELRLKIYPLVLGEGKRLFDHGTIPMGLKLINSTTSPNGVIVATYRKEGPIKKGTFADGQ